jgi:hypothetical protein
MEETMRVLTINELMRLTRIELCDLIWRITNELPTFPDSSPERANALTTLRNIPYVLTRSVTSAAMAGVMRGRARLRTGAASCVVTWKWRSAI